MTDNYAAGTPVGKNGVPLFNSPAPYKAVARYFVENGSASSVITLSANTTAIEIAAPATDRAVLMRWVATSDTQASVTALNLDHVVPANTFRRFVVPVESQNASAGYGSMVGANIDKGLFRRVAVITAGPGSVITTEYGSSSSY